MSEQEEFEALDAIYNEGKPTREEFIASRQTLMDDNCESYFDYMDGKVKIGIDGGLYYYEEDGGSVASTELEEVEEEAFCEYSRSL